MRPMPRLLVPRTPFVCLAAMLVSSGAIAGPSDELPTCSFIPASGEIEIYAGGNDQFQICVDGAGLDNEVRFTALNAPSWIVDQAGSSATFTNNGCAFGDVHPPASAAGQTFTVNYLVEDLDESTSTMCSFDIVVLVPPDPVCEFVPASGEIEIPAGGNDQFQICVTSGLPDHNVKFDVLVAPTWIFDQAASGAQFYENGCAFGDVHPPLSAAGQTHTVLYLVTDIESQTTTQCSFDIVVGPPPCDDLPVCTSSASNVIEVRAGVTDATLEICGESSCGNTVSLYTPMGLPGWVTPQDSFDDDKCITYLIDPPGAEFGQYTLVFQITDDVNAQSSFCEVIVDVQPCNISPECEIIPEGPITVFVGEEFSFEACGTSFCEGAISMSSSPLPAWIMDSAGGMNGDTFCRSFVGIPPVGSEGTYTVDIFLEDSVNGNLTECSVDIIVLCPDPPVCSFSEPGPIEVMVGERIDFEFCGEPACADHRVRIEMPTRPPFIDPAGHRKGDLNEKICLPITGTPGPQHAGTSWNMRVKVTDLTNGLTTECAIPIRVLGSGVCDEPPICAITQGDTIEVGLSEPFDIDICAEAACGDGAVTIEVDEASILCDSFGILEGEPGRELCAQLPCGTFGISEPGEYVVRFLVTDTSNGLTSVCETLVIAGGGSPGCAEEEPNNELAQCTLLDARSCQRVECGVAISGYLDESGSDVDLYCVEGLTPLGIYSVQIINGVNRNLEFACASAVCIDESGGRIGADEQSSVVCAADETGTMFIGVSGCGDLDLDGQLDSESRGNPPHGATGPYQVLIGQPSDVTELSIPCHADMNNDGVVNSADLGMLIGVFGESCAP